MPVRFLGHKRAEPAGRARLLGGVLCVAALPFAALALAALLGLGLSRGVPAGLAAGVAIAGVGVTALGVGRVFGGRLPGLAVGLIASSGAVLTLWPLYLPGERAVAAERGLRSLGASDAMVSLARAGLAWFGPEGTRLVEPRALAGWTPIEPSPPATRIVVPEPSERPEPPRLDPEETAPWVPLERSGDRLLVSAHVESQSGGDDVQFILDTGAAITTLTRRAARAAELALSDESPVVVLNADSGGFTLIS